MTNDDFFDCGQAEGFKGAVHLVVCCLAGTMALYNLGAYLLRPSRRLAVNVGLYAGWAVFEARQVRGHWGTP